MDAVVGDLLCRCQHNQLFGRHLERYQELSKSDRSKALEYHLLHLPLRIRLYEVVFKVGDVLQVPS